MSFHHSSKNLLTTLNDEDLLYMHSVKIFEDNIKIQLYAIQPIDFLMHIISVLFFLSLHIYMPMLKTYLFIYNKSVNIIDS